MKTYRIKEALAVGVVSAAIFAGAAQAQLPVPGAGGGGAVFSNPGAGGGGSNWADPGTGAGGAMNTDPGGGSSMGARQSKPASKAPAKTRKVSKVKKHR